MFVLLYADDTVLLATNVKSFRKILKSYGDYCKEWDIDINANKSKIMVFGKHTKNTKFYINEEQIEIVKNFKYLGITFTNNIDDLLKQWEKFLLINALVVVVVLGL